MPKRSEPIPREVLKAMAEALKGQGLGPYSPSGNLNLSYTYPLARRSILAALPALRAWLNGAAFVRGVKAAADVRQGEMIYDLNGAITSKRSCS
jgi:hypothetical protein